jgi:twitching motility protein PilT
MMMQLEDLLLEMIERKASDLHLSAGQPPNYRVDGELTRSNHAPFGRDDLATLLFSVLNNDQRRHLEQVWELDFSFGISNGTRFRANYYKQKSSYAAAFRIINSNIPPMQQLGLPDVVLDLAERPRGLILVTGPTGSGKSSTLASMIDYLNLNHALHILTIEDPVEFVHRSKKSLIHQRELSHDTRSFENALKSALREDPDVILLGEMRDLETIRLAITAAETGHLVMGTLHTSNASQTVDRIVDVFPGEQQKQIRTQLSNSLIGVLSQTLLSRVDPVTKEKKGRCCAVEVLVNTPAIANLIRESKTAQIYSSIQTGAAFGMQTLEHSLKALYTKSQITLEDAMGATSRPEEFKRLISEGQSAGSKATLFG